CRAVQGEAPVRTFTMTCHKGWRTALVTNGRHVVSASYDGTAQGVGRGERRRTIRRTRQVRLLRRRERLRADQADAGRQVRRMAGTAHTERRRLHAIDVFD